MTELLGDGVMWNLVSVRLETVLGSVQDRCMVCAKRTIGSSGNLFSVCFKIVLSMTQDRCKVSTERAITSKIVLDANDGTPR